jgi:hypothetical protein
MRTTPTEISRRRAGERGAALVTSLLVAMLMLAAGGALLVTTGMTASNAVDSTAEAQAYYAAEAGLQAALTVIRRNRIPAGAPTPNFHNLVCGSALACTNGGNNLSAWLPYEAATGRVRLSNSPDMTYSVTVRDADKGAADAIALSYVPRFLTVQAIGRGPKGATKVLKMMVDDFAFDFTAHAAVAVRSNDTNGDPMAAFSIGNSNPHLWNGNDTALPPLSSLAAFAVTNAKDYDGGDTPSGLGVGTLGKAEKAISNDGSNVIGSDQLTKLDPASLETWLQNADNARAFLTEMRARAEKLGRFNPSDFGSVIEPKFSFVDGDVSFNGSDHGAGLLIVTGNYSQGGSASYSGIVLALGEGNVDRNGTPGIEGALVVAKFQHDWNSTSKSYTGTSKFLSPSVTSSGGGNSLVGYNSEWVRKAMEALGNHVLGVIEE